MAMSVPLGLKPVTMYVRRAERLDKAPEPEAAVVAYHCRLYATEKAMELQDNTEEGDEFLRAMAGRLEDDQKTGMTQFSQEEGKEMTTIWAMKEFTAADEEDMAGLADQDTARTFFAAAVLFDVLRQFDTTDEDMNRRRIYCKWKASEILKAVKEGKTPTPGGYGEDVVPTHTDRRVFETPSAATTDRDVLVGFFRATGGESWSRTNLWDTNVDISRWHGLTVDSLGRVVGLSLASNQLSGIIPASLGRLSNLRKLDMSRNQLSGTIPPSLRGLSNLRMLNMAHNQLGGTIPQDLANLKGMEELWLQGNQLEGPIPKELGTISKLEKICISSNQLTGSIPEELWNLSALTHLWLSNNNLEGDIPIGAGAARKLERLCLNDNQLTGTVPKELANLSALTQLLLNNNSLEGGPASGEDLESWRERLERQRPAEETAAPSISWPKDIESQEEQVAPPPGLTPPFSRENGGTERLFRAEVAAFPSLEELTRDRDDAALEEVKRLIQAPARGSFSPGFKLIDEDKGRELSRLVAIAKALHEMASTHTEDKDIRLKEQRLPPFSKAYYTAVKTGLYNAYLAASVVASSLVCTSKSGGMEKAGKALELMSGMIPVVGGLAGFVAAALQAGDRHVQTRRVVKITDIASDAAECCSLGRRLALRLTEGLAEDTVSTTDRARTGGVAGGSARSHGAGTLPDGANEHDVMEWFVQGVASYDSDPRDARRATTSLQAGKKLGKRHLHTLLEAVGQDCLQGIVTTEAKVEILLRVILPEALVRPAATLSAPEEPVECSFSPVPSHDGALDQIAELAAVKEKLEALQLDNENIQNKIKTVEKAVRKPTGEHGGEVDSGWGQVSMQERKTKTKEEFWQEAEKGASTAVDQQYLTPDQHQAATRDNRAFAAEVDDRVDRVDNRLEGMEKRQDALMQQQQDQHQTEMELRDRIAVLETQLAASGVKQGKPKGLLARLRGR